jgi:dihydroorotase
LPPRRFLTDIQPNLKPPITDTEQALLYKAQLQAIDPSVEYLMTLYLHPDLTPDEIRKASEAGIVGVYYSLPKLSAYRRFAGVKSYPRGVTTNSEGGIESYEMYYPVFEAMQEVGMVLNLHGEIPSDASTVHISSVHKISNLIQKLQNTHVINAEPRFLPHLHKLHATFPSLRIVLEHATTRAAVEAVKACGPTVACTITPHHLALTVDDWAGQSWNYCKPVAKFPDDRQALRDVIAEGIQLHFPTRAYLTEIQLRSSTLLPRFGLCATPTSQQIDKHTLAELCGWHIYVSHPSPSCCPHFGIIWSSREA